MRHEFFARLKATRYRFTETDTHALEMWLSITLLWWFLWLLFVYFFAASMGDRYYVLYIFLTATVSWSLYLTVACMLACCGIYICWWGNRQARRFSMFVQACFWFFHFFLFFSGESLVSVPIFSLAHAAAAAWCYFSLSVIDPPEHPDYGSTGS